MVAADSREPIRKARVDLIPSTGDWRDSVYADNDGRFEFRAVPTGRYTLSAWKSGYAPTRFGTRTFWEPAAVIALDAGQVLDGFEIVIARGAAISGRVVDDAGEPVTDMTISIGRAAPVDGRLQFQPFARSTTTDDRGEYRVGGLPPGSYVVNVVGRTGPSMPIAGGEGGFRARSVFYPQTPFLSQARPIAVRAGEEVGSIDVAFTPDTLATPTVSGRVIDPQGGVANAGVLVTSGGDDGVPNAVRGQVNTVQDSGEFSMRLPPGDYTFAAQATGMVAATRLTVEQTDISNVELVLARAATVAGRVVFEGTAPRPSGLEVMTRPPPNGLVVQGLTVRAGRVRGDGSFTISNLLGLLELRVVPEGRGWRPKSILIGGRNAVDMPIEFKGGEDVQGVVIVMTDRTASLTGTVVNTNQAPAVTSLSVVVFPDDSRQAAHRARWVRPDQHGRFVVSDLAPGQYFVAVAVDVDDMLWKTPAYLERLRAGATRVTLGDGDSKSITVEWTEPR